MIEKLINNECSTFFDPHNKCYWIFSFNYMVRNREALEKKCSIGKTAQNIYCN